MIQLRLLKLLYISKIFRLLKVKSRPGGRLIIPRLFFDGTLAVIAVFAWTAIRSGFVTIQHRLPTQRKILFNRARWHSVFCPAKSLWTVWSFSKLRWLEFDCERIWMDVWGFLQFLDLCDWCIVEQWGRLFTFIGKAWPVCGLRFLLSFSVS